MFLIRPILIITSILISASTEGQINFKESSLKFNVNHRMDKWSVGSGVSVYDFNQDGLDDLTLGTEAGKDLGFYINEGGRFSKIDSPIDNKELVKQILWVDYDNDGDPDLYVAVFDGINRLYKNKGDMKFSDITEFSLLPMTVHRGYGAVFGDYNRDGWLDLYYVSRDIPGSENFLNQNRLFENNADGTFTEVTFEANAADQGKIPFCSAFIDINNDMWPDLYIANDKYSTNAMLLNNTSGGFRNISQTSQTDFSMNAMCVNAEDYNNDGWTDIYVTNTTEGSKCLVNKTADSSEGFILFEDFADSLGITYAGNTGWGSQFFDADNDGDLDLYVSGAVPDDKKTSSAFFENTGARFVTPDIKSLRTDTTFSYANAIGDLNNDGYADVVVQNNTPDKFFLWENYSVQKNNYLKVKLEGVKSNKDAIGSRIDIYMGDSYQTKYTKCGSGFLGQNSLVKIIGCGNYTNVDSLIITWSSGHVDKLTDISVNQSIDIKEGDSTDGVITTDPDITIKVGELKTSTSDIDKMSEIVIYPNPGKEKITINAEHSFSAVQVFRLDGTTMGNYNFAKTTSHTIETHSYPSGVYLIKVHHENGQLRFSRWLKID